jgi:cytochrome c-type biogenesis protein CcmH/NrfG
LEREAQTWIDGHIREHEQEERNRERVAVILDSMRVEARAANDLRLEGMNDLRSQLNRQAGTFVTFDRWDAELKSDRTARTLLAEQAFERIVAIENKQSNAEGRAAGYAVLIALIPTLVAIAGIIIAVTQ